MDSLSQAVNLPSPASTYSGGNDNRGRRASHVSKACDQCRDRKCKCDGKPEVCYACRILGLACTWKGKDKRGGVPAQLDTLRNRLRVLEDHYERLVVFLNLNGAAGGAQGQAYPSPSIKTPEIVHQSPLTPVSSAPSSPVAGLPAGLRPSTGSFTSPGMDDNFLAIPTVHRHQRSGSVTSTDSGFIGWGSGMSSPNASYPSSPYSAPPDHLTGPVGELPQNVGYVIEQIANPEVAPVFVFYANSGQAADENPIPDSSMADNIWDEQLFGHM